MEYRNILGKNLKIWKFHFQSMKSILVTKIKWKRCPICRNWPKIAHSGEFSVVQKIFRKFPKYQNLAVLSSKSSFVGVIFRVTRSLPRTLGCTPKQPDSREKPEQQIIRRTGLSPSTGHGPSQGGLRLDISLP